MRSPPILNMDLAFNIRTAGQRESSTIDEHGGLQAAAHLKRAQLSIVFPEPASIDTIHVHRQISGSRHVLRRFALKTDTGRKLGMFDAVSTPADRPFVLRNMARKSAPAEGDGSFRLAGAVRGLRLVLLEGMKPGLLGARLRVFGQGRARETGERARKKPRIAEPVSAEASSFMAAVLGGDEAVVESPEEREKEEDWQKIPENLVRTLHRV